MVGPGQSIVEGIEEQSADPTREDLPLLSGRLTWLLVVFMLVVVGFIGRAYWLTILRGPYFKDLTENNFMLEAPLIAPRGLILDRNGLPLAINQTRYAIEMSPFRLGSDEIATSVRRLAALLDQPDLVGRAGEVSRLKRPWERIVLARDLEIERVLPILEQSFRLPGVIVNRHQRRHYPVGPVGGVVTGHLGKIDKDLWERLREQDYLLPEKIGRLGAERTFESFLHGQHGSEIVIRDARGQPRSRFDVRSATPGQTLILTLDRELQQKAYNLLGDQRGVIVAMDPRDGAVLAMAAQPTYDPNTPRHGYQYNKITRGTYAPGSTFKVVTAAAGLGAGLDPDDSYYCDGYYEVPGLNARFACNARWGHEDEALLDALEHSCNVFFYNWAKQAGAQRLVETAAAFGFGQTTGFDLAQPNAESAGTLVWPAAKPYLGSVLQMGIGQGRMIDVTPIQMARAYAALANGGRLLRPRIVKEIRSAGGELVRQGVSDQQGLLPLTDEQRGRILEGLWNVVHRRRGTARKAEFPESWGVAGKTGTAQTGRKEADALFVGFAPMEDPEIVVFVLVEDGGHGGETAAPLARELLAQYFGEPSGA